MQLLRSTDFRTLVRVKMSASSTATGSLLTVGMKSYVEHLMKVWDIPGTFDMTLDRSELY